MNKSYKNSVMNPKAAEFVPKHIIERNKLFDKLEQKFVEEHGWIFEYDPLADILEQTKVSQQRKRKFEVMDLVN